MSAALADLFLAVGDLESIPAAFRSDGALLSAADFATTVRTRVDAYADCLIKAFAVKNSLTAEEYSLFRYCERKGDALCASFDMF